MLGDPTSNFQLPNSNMQPFDYFSPTTISEATRIFADYNGETRALAGGTDLLIRVKRNQWHPRAIVNLKHIPGLRDISLNGELRLGALVTLNDLIRSPIIREHFPVLAYTASKMAGVQVRTLATVGGNLCNASPAADTAPPLIALNARVVVVGTHGERVISLDEFFTGVGKSALAPDEILREILVPRDASVRASYTKLEHREAMDIAIAGVAVGVRIQNSEFRIQNCEDVRIVLGAVAPTPMRARQAEAILRGNELTEERIREAARVAASEAKPIDDVRSSAWYRREMIEVLTRRQLMEIRG
ncbi:aerobic carbon-monoxide dehydrogenase medium subunit [Anaerolineae bacterium]|nr:aerobic carbon-monoxide dehydrogenase medium subunit [Anaerolineae bacterium]